MASTIVAYLLIFTYFITDKRVRSDKTAQQLTPSETDRRSTGYLLAAYGLSIFFLLISPLLNYAQIGHIAIVYWGWLGIALMLAGIALRAWAARVLGRFYTRTLLTTTDHRIVQDGPYRLIRHPGYSGSLLVWIGAGLAVSNWIALALVTLACTAAYLYRIKSEETMLIDAFGQAYLDYCQKTKRLIPFVY
jgi:protein-S-isoprenylcysteine O-methyltransferase